MTREDDCTMTVGQWAELDVREHWMSRRRTHQSYAEAACDVIVGSVWGVALGWAISRALMWWYGL